MTIVTNPNEFLFSQKYRPSSIDEVIMPKRLKDECMSYVKDGQIPHLLFTGKPGIGKTTVAYALANQIGADLLYINASNETGVDTIRTKVIQFASTASFESNLKVVLLDEADRMTPAAQDILRPVMEEFSKNTRFILTGNYKQRISDAIHSRCIPIDFTCKKEEKEELVMKAWKRSMEILKNENIEFDKKTVATIVTRFFPDMRRVMNALQKAGSLGKIDDI
ncbi:MAG TPA: AAA family ATPase, partial [Methanosarcina sp.]|nr:AAA family ATPase [Methanosarcina sp.]